MESRGPLGGGGVGGAKNQEDADSGHEGLMGPMGLGPT